MDWCYEDVQIGNRKMSEWKLKLQEVKIPQPAVKKNLVSVPGCDGCLDYTESFGRVFYENRTNCTFIFDYLGDYYEFQQVVSWVANEIHGRKKQITIGYDNQFYYVGRLEIEPKKTDEVTGTITLIGTLEPYKYKQNLTVKSYEVSTEENIKLENLRRPVVPTITVTGEITIEFDGNVITVPEGIMKIPDIVLTEGENIVTLSGQGTIKFEYQEAGL